MARERWLDAAGTWPIKDARTSDDIGPGPGAYEDPRYDHPRTEQGAGEGLGSEAYPRDQRSGRKKLVVTVETKAGLPDNDYLKNKYLDLSDSRRVYRFDAKTQRLEGFEAYLHEAGGDVLVLTIEKIEYDLPIDPSVFTLKLPDNVQWFKEPERLPDNEKYEKMTPKEAAQAFFEACEREIGRGREVLFVPRRTHQELPRRTQGCEPRETVSIEDVCGLVHPL